MNKRKYDEMISDNIIRYYKNKEIYYFKDEKEELEYFKYKNTIIKNNRLELKYKNEKELKDNIFYALGLVPNNALFSYNDKYYLFLKFDNNYQIVFAQEYDIKNKKRLLKYILKPNTIIKRILKNF
jgi:hypothetical protein